MMEICDHDAILKTASALVETLQKKKLQIALAESCTGGMVASMLVEVPGASLVFEEGFITYSDRAKHELLGVATETLETYTAVSAQTAKEMALGTATCTGASLAVSVTGYAGPGPGEDGTPAGTVYIGTCYENEVQVCRYLFSGDRHTVRKQATKMALQGALTRLTASFIQ